MAVERWRGGEDEGEKTKVNSGGLVLIRFNTESQRHKVLRVFLSCSRGSNPKTLM